jgi:hypothetical protein
MTVKTVFRVEKKLKKNKNFIKTLRISGRMDNLLGTI